MIDLTRLTAAVTAVAGIAAERDRYASAIVAAQADVDALTAALVAAVATPAEAVGVAAVSEALASTGTLTNGRVPFEG